MKVWKWTLGMEDRVALHTLLLGASGSRAEQALADSLIEATLSKEELKAFNLRQEGNQLLWNTVDTSGKALPLEKEIAFGPEARSLVTRNLAMMDEAHALPRMMIHLYDMFIATPWPDPVEAN